MGKHSDYKKRTTAECHYCDYSYRYRKGHKCSHYKKLAKKFKRNDGIKEIF